MKRPLILGVIGLVLLVAAVMLSLTLGRKDQVAAPAVEPAPAPAPATDAAGAAKPLAATAPPVEPAPRPGTPSFDIVRVNPRGDAVIAGRAQPESEVTVLDADKVIGKVTADPRGEWVLLPAEPLAAGNRELSLQAQRPGETPMPSDKVVVLSVPDRRAAQPAPAPAAATEPGPVAASAPPAAAPAQPLAVLVPRDGAGPSTVLQGPSAPAPGRPRTAIDVVDYTDQGQLTLSGSAEPGARVQLYLDNQPIGEALADAQGRWQLVPGQPIAPGLHKLRVDELGPAGRVVGRAEIPFQRAEIVASLPAESRTVVQPGNSLWQIARVSYGRGTQYSVIYEANRTQIRDPDLIYPGQIFVIPPSR